LVDFVGTDFNAITMHPIKAANSKILTASNGSANPSLPVFNMYNPIRLTALSNGCEPASKPYWCMSEQLRRNPAITASNENIFRDKLVRGISLPDCCVRNMEKIISTTIPPT
jgi:hypothetical protein